MLITHQVVRNMETGSHLFAGSRRKDTSPFSLVMLYMVSVTREEKEGEEVEEMREVVGGTDDKLKSLFSAPLRLINENSSASTQPPTSTHSHW